ncbi:MAG TPA: BTAD domain-containing putative transcriptional regulator [Hyphomicrobiaceae bacterium]|jgi:DNA-binding SARP family transcriptional activator/TolB-like protein
MSSERTARFGISLFGRFQLIGRGGPIGLTSKKHAALLAYLAATHPAAHSREKLTTLLWGGHVDPQARQNLRQALSRLRHILGKDVILSSADTIALAPGLICCDVPRFQMLVQQASRAALSEAVDLYRDRLLCDLQLAEEGWTQWRDLEQGRLEGMALNTIIRVGEEALTRGDHDRAGLLARRAIGIDDLREDAYRLYMRATAFGGRKAEALQQYNRLHARLRRELNTEPDAATRRLAGEIAARREAIAVAPKPPLASPINELVRTHADLAGSAPRAVLALDDAAAEDGQATGPLRAAGDQLVELFNARIVDCTGNQLLLEFSDPRSAVRAAHAAQAHQLRMSAHASTSGKAAKTIASRLLPLAAPGQLLVSDEVRDALTDELDAKVEDLGEYDLGAGAMPVRAYRAEPPQASTARERRSAARILPAIAVVPFSVSNGGGNEKIMGQLLAHEIIAHLCQAKEFDVISRLSTRVFAGRNASVADIGAWLGADYVLWGNCEIRRDDLYVSFELANTSSQMVIWAGSRVAPLSAVREGYGDIVAHIAAETSACALAHELPRARSQPLETLDNYCLMLAAINLIHRTQPSSFTHARSLLELLTERLPHHPLPQAWMAQWHVMKVSQGWSDDVADEGRLALDCAQRARDSDPNCSIAIAMDGWVHTHLLKRFDIAAERFEVAVEVNPSDCMAWLLKGTMHSFLGQGEAAIQAAERALRLSPLDPRRSYHDCLVASIYCAANQFDRAIDLSKRSLRVNRLHSSTLRTLICALALSDRIDEARQVRAELMKLEPKLTVSGYLARHPAAPFRTGQAWARALQQAGVPA